MLATARTSSSAAMARARPSVAAHARAPRGTTPSNSNSGKAAASSSSASSSPRKRRTSRKSEAASAAAAVGGGSDVPPHVAEAREWIAAWRARTGQASSTAKGSRARSSSSGGGGSGGGGSGGGGGATAPCSVGPDGTLTFTAAKLSQVSYTDVKL